MTGLPQASAFCLSTRKADGQLSTPSDHRAPGKLRPLSRREKRRKNVGDEAKVVDREKPPAKPH